MSVVSLLGVKVLNNPAKFSDSYHFEITFECLEQLQKGERDLICPLNKTRGLTQCFRSRMEAHLCWIGYLVSLQSLRELCKTIVDAWQIRT